MNSVKVSVIIPIYNVEPYIQQCLQSVADQTLREIEIICVDDWGSNGSMALVEQFAHRESRLRILRNDSNQGVSVARNTALRHARGEYVAFIDSDDWIKPEYLDRLYSAAVEQQADAVICAASNFFDDEFNSEMNPENPFRDDDSYVIKVTGMASAFPDGILDSQRGSSVVWRKLFKRSSILESGISFSPGLVHQDTEFNFKFACLFPLQYGIPDKLYMRRIWNASTMQRTLNGSGRYHDLCVIGENCYRFLVEHNKFAELKAPFLGYLESVFGTYLHNEKFKAATVTAMQAMFQKIHFPEEYSDIREKNVRILFDAILQYTPAQRCPHRFYQALLLLNRLTPHSGLRRKWRHMLKVKLVLG